MKSFGRYMILESKKDFEKAKYDDYLKSYYLDGGYVKAPEVFPACYKYVSNSFEAFAYWDECNEEEAFASWDEWTNKHIKFVAEAKELFKK